MAALHADAVVVVPAAGHFAFAAAAAATAVSAALAVTDDTDADAATQSAIIAAAALFCPLLLLLQLNLLLSRFNSYLSKHILLWRRGCLFCSFIHHLSPFTSTTGNLLCCIHFGMLPCGVASLVQDFWLDQTLPGIRDHHKPSSKAGDRIR